MRNDISVTYLLGDQIITDDFTNSSGHWDVNFKFYEVKTNDARYYYNMKQVIKITIH